jgi:predicted GH43/DUF377 family glycosyl hydrolase
MDKNDHDLLIRVDTKLGTLIEEVQLMRDNTNQRLSTVEQTKVEKSDFNDFKVNIQNDLNKTDLTLSKTLMERNQHNEEMFKSQDQRITKIERNMYIGIGILMALQVIVPLILKYAFNF